MNSFDDRLAVSGDELPRLGIDFTNHHRLNLESKGAFPKRLSLGGRRVSYLMSEIRAWVASRAAERDTSAALRSEQALRGVQTRRKAKSAPESRHQEELRKGKGP